MSRKAVVCFCMDVTQATIDEAYRQGFRNPELIKRFTGAFMGPCQGKTCAANVLQQAAQLSGVEPGTLRAPSCRPPLIPITLGVLAAGFDESTQTDRKAH